MQSAQAAVERGPVAMPPRRKEEEPRVRRPSVLAGDERGADSGGDSAEGTAAGLCRGTEEMLRKHTARLEQAMDGRRVRAPSAAAVPPEWVISS